MSTTTNMGVNKPPLFSSGVEPFPYFRITDPATGNVFELQLFSKDDAVNMAILLRLREEVEAVQVAVTAAALYRSAISEAERLIKEGESLSTAP